MVAISKSLMTVALIKQNKKHDEGHIDYLYF